MNKVHSETRTARVFGWWSLALWAMLGFALEIAHAWKVSAYLDDELTRMLLRLAHAHGVGLSLVSLVYAHAGVLLFGARRDAARVTGALLRLGSVALPLGFALGAVQHPEGDPGLGIVLSPLGAVAVIVALLRLAVAALREH